MTSAPADTAILLFAHAAAHEAKAKAFSSEHRARASKRVATALLEHTLRVINSARIPILAVYTAQQKGNTFGERLANAFQDAFAAGYQQVICVGSDCPTLATADLLQAQRALQQHGMVVGPAADGGAYLIGMHADCFDPQSLAMLNWQTQQVLQELSLYASRQHARCNGIKLLQQKSDVDSSEDLRLALERLPVLNRLRARILASLSKGAARTFTFRHILHRLPDRHLRKLQLRAPPR